MKWVSTKPLFSNSALTIDGPLYSLQIVKPAKRKRPHVTLPENKPGDEKPLANSVSKWTCLGDRNTFSVPIKHSKSIWKISHFK